MASGQGRCMTIRIRVQGSGAAADRSAKYPFSIAVRSRGKPRNILFRSHGRAGPYKPFPPMLEDCCCPAVCSKYFHRLSCGGTGAVMRTGLRRTGWTNSIERACSEMLPSRFERGAPYFRSPRIGQRGDCQRADFPSAPVRLHVVKQAAFGAHARGKDLAFLIGCRHDFPVIEQRGCADPEVRIGRIRLRASLGGTIRQPPLRLGQVLQRSVPQVFERV